MDKDIETYLRELQAALSSAGADPALMQDALFDAEEHLQAEMAAGTSFATAAEEYGPPAEVAAAYLGIPVTGAEAASVAAASVAAATVGAPATPQSCWTCGRPITPGAAFCAACGTPALAPAPPGGPTPARAPVPPGGPVPPVAPLPPYIAGGAGAPPYGAGAPVPAGVQAGMAAAATPAAAPPSVLRDIFGVFADARVWKALVYMILSLCTGIAYFTIVVTGVSTFVPLLILIVGIPLFLLFLGAVRGLALFEGRLVEWLLGTRMPRRPRSEPPGAGFLQRIWFWFKDGRTWASMVYMVLMLPLGIAYFTIAVTGIATGVGLLTTPLWVWTADHDIHVNGGDWQWWFPHWWGVPIAMIVGAAILVGLMHLVKWIGRGHAAFAKAMLVRLTK